MIMLFRMLVDSMVRPALTRRYGPDVNDVLNRIWARAQGRRATLPRQSSLGATLMVHLAAVTAAAYETFVEKGATSEEATRTVYDVAWTVYEKMGRAVWVLSAVIGKNYAERMRAATVAFRTFPFSAPSYEWTDVPAGVGIVGFDCHRCPVAEYFKAQQLSKLCVQTWCALDFPLAEKVWHSKLERSGSIADGASRCDFRWHAQLDHPAAVKGT